MELFKRIAIVGVGLIGGSMGLALKRAGFQGRLVGVSRAQTLEQALEMGVVDEGWGYEELAQAMAGTDLVFLCTPIHRILTLLVDIGPLAAPGTLITDAGSTKRCILSQASRCLPAGVYFIGGHPMAGSEKSGVRAADPFLFQNAIYILTPSSPVPEVPRAAFTELLTVVGARVVELSAEVHDQVVAAISHLPQIMATALVGMVGKMDEKKGCFLPLAAGGFRDMTRIASSPYAPLWEDICSTNADQIHRMIDRYIEGLKGLASRLGEESLGQDFAYANQTRASMPRDVKGFIRPLFELLVVAQDRPGVIAEIATSLAREQLNISDIEIMKVREGEGGTVRLGFDRQEAAKRALAILRGLGYAARQP